MAHFMANSVHQTNC